MKRGLPFLLSASMALISLQIFSVTGNYASAEIAMTIDSKIDGEDIRTDIKIDTPDNTKIDSTDVRGNDKVNIVAKTPRNGDNDEKEKEAANKIKDEVRKAIDECDPLLQNDLPDQDEAAECENAIEDANNEIDEEQNDLPPP